jgi:thiol-disulfide isomerase/thioredoxin
MENLVTGLIQNGELVFPLIVLLGIALLAGMAWRNRSLIPKRWWHWPVSLTTIAVIAISALSFFFVAEVDRALDRRAEQIQFRAINDGSLHRVRDYAGKVVMINFWATWCPPCRKEMPDLNRIAAAYRDRGVVVIAVSDEPRETLMTFLRRYPQQTVIGYFQEQKPTTRVAALAERGRPTTLVLDRRGRVRTRIIGAGSFEDFARVVERLL